MRPLQELINTDDSAMPLVRQWAAEAVRPVELLPASEQRADALLATQVTTRSPMGAVVYETGGILIDHGWLRVLGSGHPRLTRTLPRWNGPMDGRWQRRCCPGSRTSALTHDLPVAHPISK